MRLDKFLAYHLEASRSEVTKLLKAGRIRIDGAIHKLGATSIQKNQTIYFDDHLIVDALEKRYFMINKPFDYVCSHDDSFYPSVSSLASDFHPELLNAAGRLDADTTGLVLLTDDGQWLHRVTSPKSACDKKYFVTLLNPLQPENQIQFEKGVQLHGEKLLTKPAKLEYIDDYHAYLTLQEGKYHQVKRMFAAVHNRVVALHRVSIGALSLDVDLGDCRALTQAEINLF